MQRQTGSGKGRTYVYRLSVEPSETAPEYYEFARKLCKIPTMTGTCHGEDIPLLFKTKFSPRFKEGDDNYKAQQAFLNYLMEFTKNGKFNDWTALAKGETKNVQCMEIGRDKWAMQELANMDKLRVWDELYDVKNLL